jgi:hypothetical protein
MSSSTDEKLDEPNAQLRIRPLRAGDDGPIRDIFAGMSAKSRYLRFHSPMPRLSPALLQQLAATKPGITSPWWPQSVDATSASLAGCATSSTRSAPMSVSPLLTSTRVTASAGRCSRRSPGTPKTGA